MLLIGISDVGLKTMKTAPMETRGMPIRFLLCRGKNENWFKRELCGLIGPQTISTDTRPLPQIERNPN